MAHTNDADTTAAPAMLSISRWFGFGRLDLLLSPLTIGDLGWYDRMGGVTRGEMGCSDRMLLIWLGLRRRQPWISYRACRRMFRRPKAADLAFALTLALNEAAFRPLPEDEDTGGQEAGGQFSASIMRALAAMYQWPACVVFDLTAAQADLYLADNEDPDAVMGSKNFGNDRAAAEAYVAMRQAEKQAGRSIQEGDE